jgi:hypothetical protein
MHPHSLVNNPGIDDIASCPQTIGFGVPLSRASTIPAHDSPLSAVAKKLDVTSRRAGGASKLARMGFTTEQALPTGHLCSSPKVRFGIKSLMQSMKGK